MRVRRIVILTLIMAVLAGIVIYARELNAQPSTVYWGSKGANVSTVQSKLKAWGYYTGPVDSVYGAETFNAVKRFQAKNGLKADGVVGPATWAALGVNVGARTAATYQPSRGVSPRGDAMLLSRVVNGEAAAEPYLGKVAVASVILNRTKSDKFPNTLAGVIYQPNAFESITNGVANREPSAESIKAAQDAMNGWDPTQGCLFFWNPSKPVNKWIWSRPIITRIGQHVFAK